MWHCGILPILFFPILHLPHFPHFYTYTFPISFISILFSFLTSYLTSCFISYFLSFLFLFTSFSAISLYFLPSLHFPFHLSSYLPNTPLEGSPVLIQLHHSHWFVQSPSPSSPSLVSLTLFPMQVSVPPCRWRQQFPPTCWYLSTKTQCHISEDSHSKSECTCHDKHPVPKSWMILA